MNEKQIQKQVEQLVKLAMSGDKQAVLQIEQIMQAAQIAPYIQNAIKSAQAAQNASGSTNTVSYSKNGSKLNYIKQLKGSCPEGYEVEYFANGGGLAKRCKPCEEKQKMEEGAKTPVDAFKCGRKMKKKVEKASEGEKAPVVNTPTRSPKQAKLVKTVITYPDRLEVNERKVLHYDDGTYSVMNSGWDRNTGMWTSSFRGRLGEFGDYSGTPKLQQIADSIHEVDFRHNPMYVPAIKHITLKLLK